MMRESDVDTRFHSRPPSFLRRERVMVARRLLSMMVALLVCGCLPQEFRQAGSFEKPSAFGIDVGMTRAEANRVISTRYSQFRFIHSECMRMDHPNVPQGPFLKTFAPLECPGEGEDVYHAYSGMRVAVIFVVFRNDRVTRIKWDAVETHFS